MSKRVPAAKRVYSRVLGCAVKVPFSISQMDEEDVKNNFTAIWLSSYEMLKATGPISLGKRVGMAKPLQ